MAECDLLIWKNGIKYNNPYDLRVTALDKTTNYTSTSSVEHYIIWYNGEVTKTLAKTDKETEKQIQRRGESGFQKALDENRTIAEALKKNFK
jgi:CRISPR-associated endonuclease Csn1